MKIKEGKFYRTRNGKRVGPMMRTDQSWSIEEGFIWSGGTAYLYRDDGTTQRNPELNIVAEWVASPVRTVTRKEIVPGVYGLIRSGEVEGNCFVRVSLERGLFSAAELRAAADVFTQLADALEDQK